MALLLALLLLHRWSRGTGGSEHDDSDPFMLGHVLDRS
jgi:hypothetical protein